MNIWFGGVLDTRNLAIDFIVCCKIRSRSLLRHFTFKERSFIRLKRKMQLTYVAVVVLASMIFVLSGMVGYVYWQQTRMLQHIQSLAVVVSTQFVRPHSHQEEEAALAPVPEHELEAQVDSELPALVREEEEDDRVSVDEKADIVEGPPPSTDDVDNLDGKTAAQLRDLLTKKGIPFGKRDAKTVLLNLLKATA